MITLKYNTNQFNNKFISSIKKNILQDNFSISDENILSTLKGVVIDASDFLRLLEKDILKLYPQYSSYDLELIENKIKYHAIRSQVFEGCFLLIFSTLSEELVTEKQAIYYSFFDKSMLVDFNSHFKSIPFNDLEDKKKTKSLLDKIYRKISVNRQMFYLKKMFRLYSSIKQKENKKLVKLLKKFEKKKSKVKLTEKQQLELEEFKSSFIDDELQFALLYIKKYMPKVNDKDDFQNKYTFRGVLNILHEDKNYYSLLNAIKDISFLYQNATQDITSLDKQFTDYLSQIGLYMCFMEHISKEFQNFNLYEFLVSEDFLTVVFLKDNAYEIKTIIKEPIYLQLPYNDGDIKRYVNKFIAMLNLMEEFYFQKLLILYLKTIKESD